MEKIICENCGQEYSATFDACPLCGHVNEQLGTSTPEPAAAYTATSDEAQRKQKERAKDMNRIPTWLIAAICIILGLALIVGAIYIISVLGLFRSETPVEETPAAQTETLPETPDAVPSQEAAQATPADQEAQSPDPEEPSLTTDPVQEDESAPPAEETSPEPEETDEMPDNAGPQAPPEDTTSNSAESPSDTEPPAAVPNVSCDSITLDRTDITLSFRGETFTFSPAVVPSSAKSGIQWSSSNDELVTVNQDGTVNARVGTGDDYVVITAQCGDKTATCIVRCSFETATELLPLNLEDVTLFYAGETATLSVVDESVTGTVTWSTSNPSVVSVDANGKIIAMSRGTAEIQASYQGRTGSCVVRCSFGAASTTTDSAATAVTTTETAIAYTLTHEDVTLKEGESFTLGINASEGEVPDHTWSTGNSSVCTIDASGKVTAKGAGTSTVLTTVDGQLLQCIVRVRAPEAETEEP